MTEAKFLKWVNLVIGFIVAVALCTPLIVWRLEWVAEKVKERDTPVAASTGSPGRIELGPGASFSGTVRGDAEHGLIIEAEGSQGEAIELKGGTSTPSFSGPVPGSERSWTGPAWNAEVDERLEALEQRTGGRGAHEHGASRYRDGRIVIGVEPLYLCSACRGWKQRAPVEGEDGRETPPGSGMWMVYPERDLRCRSCRGLGFVTVAALVSSGAVR